eukprot:XP_014028307.1 PREDICTED: WD repeat-containing protein 88-like isoform X1 [Salmo salar]
MTCRNIDPLSLDETIDEGKEETDVEKRRSSVWEHQELAQIPIKVLRGHTDAVTSCHFCFDDTKVLTSSHDKTATLWVGPPNTRTDQLPRQDGHSMGRSTKH